MKATNMENAIQHEIVMWFSHEYPDLRGLLFEINNNSTSVRGAMYHRSLGRVAGASDLIFFYKTMLCIELKAPGSSHEKRKILRQLEWGEQVVKAGGLYVMTSDVVMVKRIIKGVINGDDMSGYCADIVKKIDTSKSYVKF